MEDDPLLRLVLAQQVQNAIDNVDMYVTLEDDVTLEDIDKLILYARKTGAPIPDLPSDGRREGVIKTLIRYWTVRETLGLQVALLGGEEHHVI